MATPNDTIIFTSLLVLAVIVSHVPLLRCPFKWMETFFHELSHGLAALMTLGRIHRIQLKWNGAGVCTTSGGSRIWILLWGYLGASAWGALIYIAGWLLTSADTVRLFYFFMALLGICTVFWVRDVVTLIIMVAMFCIFFLPVYFPNWTLYPYLLEFIGLYVVLSAIQSPLHLIDGELIGDGAELQKILFLPEGVWIALWFIVAVCTFYFLWMLNAPDAGMWIIREVLIPVLGWFSYL